MIKNELGMRSNKKYFTIMLNSRVNNATRLKNSVTRERKEQRGARETRDKSPNFSIDGATTVEYFTRGL